MSLEKADKDSLKRPENTVIAVVGPTSSGKTALSIELACLLNGEVIACDSRNIYRYMDIGTAKPTKEEMKGIRHHLIDVADPDSVFTVAEYKRQGRKAIDDIFAAGKIPIVCGGTGFYSRALLEGLSIPEVAPNQELREKLNSEAEEKGNEYLHDLLMQKDPEAAAKIKANDRFRIVRALEVMEALAIPFSMASKKEPVPFDVLWIGLTFEDRTKLKERIIERLKIQIEDGLEAEVRSLYDRYGKTRSLQNAVTYKQFISYFEKEISYEEAFEECVKHNYQLARKQLIWFRSNPEMNWLKVDETPDLLEAALEIIRASKA
ncbi:MAG: tRNA (adenosine(37)-N6)-dimethylallyltransferase MiaA [Cyanobacteriota/Melainabacteria group bacterium]|nr:tRNA (adenosine(37)-N6)-dimethylallyltransferase MiaA [Candidatus Obscuribacterales bacterium]